MKLSSEIIASIKQSVLCWLATSSAENIPNVSPKEMFISYMEEYVILANIASPQSVKNIRENKQVCLSFIDVLVQKGFQLKGTAELIEQPSTAYFEFKNKMPKLERPFPIASFIKVRVTSAKAIIAPSYILYPETSEEEMITASIKQYRLK